MGILVCGLNGAGKTTFAKLLSAKTGYRMIDSEDLYFPKTDSSYEFASPRSREEVVSILEELISEDSRFVLAAVRGDFGALFRSKLEAVVFLEVPRQVRLERVRARSFQKFGERMLPGGDLYERESKWFSLVESRPEDYTERWLETLECPVLRLDGVLPPEENAERAAAALFHNISK